MKDAGVAVESSVCHTFAGSSSHPSPYLRFLGNISGQNLYDYSMTCLENAGDILETLEDEYRRSSSKTDS